MKKNTFILFGLLLLTKFANSQAGDPYDRTTNNQTTSVSNNNSNKEGGLVIVAGMQNSRLSTSATGFTQFQSNNNNTSSVWKPFFGLNNFSRLKGKFWGIYGVEYAVEGGKDDYGEIKMNYLNTHASIGHDLFDRVFVAAGIQWGQLLSAKYNSQDISDYLKSSQFSLLFSSKAQLAGKLYADIRTRVGLSNISEGSDFKSNSQFILGLSYKL